MSNMANGEPYSGRIVISPKIIQEISKYPNALDSIREYVANAWDADADRLEITIADNFLRIEDWGTGIANFELFWGIADQHKSDIELTPKFKRKPIGRKGMGKLSYMMLAEKILVESRTAYKAEYSDADLPNMKFDVIPRKKLDEVLTHKGTQITIRDLKREIKKDELIKYLKENLYGLILPIACKDHPMRIFVNGEKVTPTPFDGESGIISTSLGAIYCKLKPSKTSKIDALFRGVKVKEIHLAPTHPAKGYFNVDWVIPTLDRSNFTDSEEARVFFDEIKKYLIRNIPSKSENSPKDLEKSVRDLSKLFDDVLRDSGTLPQSMMPVTKTAKPTDLKMAGIMEQENNAPEEPTEKEKHEGLEERKRLQHRILQGKERPLKSAYGISYINRKIGRDRPAIVTSKEEKLIIINLDHDIIKNIHNLKPSQKNIALCPLIARGHFHILEPFRDVTGYEEYVDNMVSAVLSKMTSEV